MARTKLQNEHEAKSRPTGLVFPCPMAVHVHADTPTACFVMRGPRIFWAKCPACLTEIKLAPRHLQPSGGGLLGAVEPGITVAQALAEGFKIL